MTLGPLTNIAIAIHQAPDIIPLIGRCVVMGGTANVVGNVTPAAEFNLWFDPHAAAMVFDSQLMIEMVGWEICRGEAGLSYGEQQRLRALDTEIAHFILDCNASAIEAIRAGLRLFDPDVANRSGPAPDVLRGRALGPFVVGGRPKLERVVGPGGSDRSPLAYGRLDPGEQVRA